MTVQTLGGAVQDRRLAGRWFVPLIPIAIAVFCLSALAYYRIWQDGAGAASGLPQRFVVALYDGIGFVPAFMFFLLVLAWSSIWFLTGELERPGGRLGRLLGLMLALAILVNLRPDLDVAAPHGGAVGGYLALRLQSVFGYTISTLLVAPLALAALLLATDFFFYRYFEGMGRPAAPQGRGARRQLVTEAGVEHAVTDHLKGLAASADPNVERKTLSWEDLPEVDLEGALPDEPYAEPELDRVAEPATSHEPVPEEAEEADEVVTGSYSTRRAARLAREEEEDLAEERADDEDEEDYEDSYDDEESEEPEDEREAMTLHDLGLEEEGEAEADEDEEEEAYEDEDDDSLVFEDAGEPGETLAVEDSSAVGADEAWEAEEEIEDEELEDEELDLDEEFEEELETEVDEDDLLEEESERAALADEPQVTIPRAAPGARQGRLFASGLDQELLDEARQLIRSSGRASASYLQRRMRVDFDQAMELLGILAVEGLIEMEEGATSGRVVD